jgi:Pro-kumamolisin, activation domain/Domain of unknown function (DUF5011)/Immunoglobulin domain/Viral BACON domain
LSAAVEFDGWLKVCENCRVIHAGDPKFRRLCFLAAIVAALFFSSGAFAQTAPRKILRGHVPGAIARFNLQPVDHLPATNRLNLAIGLPLRNQDALDKLLQQIYDPASPNFHHYLTQEEFTENFGPTEMDYQRVIDFANASGLTVTRTYSNRVVLDVSGPVANIEQAFRVNLNFYRHPAKNRTFFAPDAEPSVDADVPILDVSGLNNFAPPHPNLQPKPLNQSATVTPKSGSGPGGDYWGNDFRNAYAPGVSMTGSGQIVGLVEFDGYYSNDIASYESQSGLPVVPLQNSLLDGVSGSPGFSGIGNAVLEVSLDIEVAIAMAPGLSKVIVYEGSAPNDILSQMAGDNQAKQLSTSWSWDTTTNATTDHLFQQFAAQGQSFFDASGDSDAYPIGTATGEPNDNPFITIVGGTTLMTSDGAWFSETTWNEGGSQGANYVGSSGGVSTFYKIPSWQTNAGAAAAGGSATMRNIPDVALTADSVWVIYGNSQIAAVGGTSVAAPLWAGFTALVNQQAVTAGRPTVGFINPAIYAIAAGANYAADFHDITTGNNFNSSSPANFSAVPGFDLCTGLGTPAGQNLINDLAGSPDPLGITPATGFAASGPIGGPFNATNWNFSLTNLGTASLNWTLAGTSSWLQFSSSGGVLAPGGSATTVTVSLNSAANNLGAGIYNATVWFTNQTSGNVQGRLFTLQIIQPLVVSPATGFTSAGAMGGPFTVTAQNFSLTNIGVAPLNWGIINTSLWLNASPGGGALAAGGAVTVTASLNPTATNLVAGIYNATVWFTNQTAGGAQSEQFILLVGQPLVQNGGFETGDFTGWTLVGDSGTVNYVDTGTYITPHSGNYAAALGQVTTLANLSQTLPTSAGQTYLLSLWLDSPSVSHQKLTPNEFMVEWNGITLFDKTNIGRIGWTNLQFIVKATDSTAVLQFGARDDNWYLGLDDVSVTPISPPSLTAQPTNFTALAGGNAVFSATAGGSAPLVYHWRINGTNLFNGGNISGATTNVLNITAATAGNAGNYDLVVTNAYGSVTSSVAVLTIFIPPTITGSLTNQTVECGGGATFTVNASGTVPLNYQWTLNNAAISGATNASFSLSGVHPPGYTIGVTITNLYGSVSSNALLTVHDTTPPVITLNGGSPIYVELGGAFTDPGATANDACAGSVSISTNGIVNINAVGTNTLIYTANDGNGNTNTATRAVIVRDTTPPTILRSFTNLVLAADTNCSAKMPGVTGTNYILATDLSGVPAISQTPTNNFILQLGTNTIVITVADASGNAAFSTNTIFVQDQTPPKILIQPQSITNLVGTPANFSAAATACTTPSYQWFFNNGLIVGQTNSTLAVASAYTTNAGNYSVVASASGGSTTSLVATLTVNLIPPGITPNSAINPDGSFTLNLIGSPGYAYILETTTNLTSPAGWKPVATNTLGTNGLWHFNDTQATNFLRRFYRLKLGP